VGTDYCCNYSVGCNLNHDLYDLRDLRDRYDLIKNQKSKIERQDLQSLFRAGKNEFFEILVYTKKFDRQSKNVYLCADI
jgi:type IV secretory pathway component VirB8